MKRKEEFVLQTIFLIRPLFFKNLLITTGFTSLLIAISVILPFLSGSISIALLFFLLILFLTAQTFFNYLQFKKIIQPAISKLYPALATMISLPPQKLFALRLQNFKHFFLISDWISTLFDILNKDSRKNQWKFFRRKLITFILLFFPFSLLMILIVKEVELILLLYLLITTLIFVNFLYQGFLKLFLLLKTINEHNS